MACLQVQRLKPFCIGSMRYVTESKRYSETLLIIIHVKTIRINSSMANIFRLPFSPAVPFLLQVYLILISKLMILAQKNLSQTSLKTP